jgi:opacity protein-like surface antigen
MRPRCIRLLVVSALAFGLVPDAPCHAQGLGIGGRFSFIKPNVDSDVDVDVDAKRYFGGHVRAWMSRRFAFELSLDRRTEENEALNLKTQDTPVQASLLLGLGGSAFAPYLLGGYGWYTHRVEAIQDDPVVSSISTRRTGFHAGIGAELRAGRHAAVHVDYRYTFLHFDDDDDDGDAATVAARATSSDGIGIPGSGLLPSHEGSMWTMGLTVYF